MTWKPDNDQDRAALYQIARNVALQREALLQYADAIMVEDSDLEPELTLLFEASVSLLARVDPNVPDIGKA